MDYFSISTLIYIYETIKFSRLCSTYYSGTKRRHGNVPFTSHLYSMADDGNNRKRRKTITDKDDAEDTPPELSSGEGKLLVILTCLQNINKTLNKTYQLIVLSIHNLYSSKNTPFNTTSPWQLLTQILFSEDELLDDGGTEISEEVEKRMEEVQIADKGKFPFSLVVANVLANFNFILIERTPNSILRALHSAARKFRNTVLSLVQILLCYTNQPITCLLTNPALILNPFPVKAGNGSTAERGAKRPRSLNRSLEARQRRAAKGKEKLKLKIAAKKAGGIPPRPSPTTGAMTPEVKPANTPHSRKQPGKGKSRLSARGPTFDVAVTVLGRPATEEDRRQQMAVLAIATAHAPSSSSDEPVRLLGSRIVEGEIILTVGSHNHQAAVMTMLAGQDAIMVVPRSGRQRLIASIPGFLAVIPPSDFEAHISRFNPGLPAGSLQVVSRITEPSPTAFIDADDRAVEFLRAHGFRLQIMTGSFKLELVGESKPKPKG